MAGYNVEDVATGYSAVRRLRTLKPDLILFDLILPGLGGLSVLSQLADYAHTRDIPVLVVTATDAEAQTLNVQMRGGKACNERAAASSGTPASRADHLRLVPDSFIGRAGRGQGTSGAGRVVSPSVV